MAGEGLVTTTSMNGLSGSRDAKEDEDRIGRSAVEPCMSDPRWEEEEELLSGEGCGEAKGFCRLSSAAGDLGNGGKFSIKTEPPRVCRGVVWGSFAEAAVPVEARESCDGAEKGFPAAWSLDGFSVVGVLRASSSSSSPSVSSPTRGSEKLLRAVLADCKAGSCSCSRCELEVKSTSLSSLRLILRRSRREATSSLSAEARPAGSSERSTGDCTCPAAASSSSSSVNPPETGPPLRPPPAPPPEVLRR